MVKKHGFVAGLVLILLLIFALPALANLLSSATATADCVGFTGTVTAVDLTVGNTYTIDFTFTLTCTGSPTPEIVSGSVMFKATSSTEGVPIAGSWPSPLSVNCTVMGKAKITSSGSTVTIIINGVTSAPLTCSLPQQRMTGGGTVDVGGTTLVVVDGIDSDSFDVTHGFEIHCGAPPPKNNRLEVNWPDHHFHLETLTMGTCVCNAHLLPPKNPDAGFNEFIGAGTGKLDGKPGAHIVFDFTDQGEPGTNDTESVIITDPADTTVLTFGQPPPLFGLKLDDGNQQAHRVGGPKVPICNP